MLRALVSSISRSWRTECRSTRPTRRPTSNATWRPRKASAILTCTSSFGCRTRPEKQGQDRGNSGVYLQGRYEIQILDSYRDPPARDGNGAIYGLFAPLMNPSRSRESGRPTTSGSGPRVFRGEQVTEKPRITVFENGVLIQDDRELNVVSTQTYRPAKFVASGPIVLQNHWCPVRFRNIWIESGRAIRGSSYFA